MLPQKFDTTIAHKMINLMPELTGTDKRVAATIIDHFNRKTAQCDPGLGRIAWLVGVSRRTAIRSVSRIVRTGILRVVRYGGHSQRNSYEPVWSSFRELEVEWKMRFRAKSRRADGSKMSPATCQTCHLPGDQPVTQTLLSNPSNETCPSGSAPVMLRVPSTPTGRKGRASKEGSQTGRDPLAPSSLVAGSRSSLEAALVAAERRWSTALNDRYAATPRIYGKIIDAIDVVMQGAATDAEMRRPGAGVAYILDQLQARSILISVQPASAAGPAQPPTRNL